MHSRLDKPVKFSGKSLDDDTEYVKGDSMQELATAAAWTNGSGRSASGDQRAVFSTGAIGGKEKGGVVVGSHRPDSFRKGIDDRQGSVTGSGCG